MSIVDNKKEEALMLLFMSINKDMNKWKIKYQTQYESPVYSGFKFEIKTKECKIFFCKVSTYGNEKELEICNYSKNLSIKNRKIRKSVKMLERYFIELSENIQLKEEAIFIGCGIEGIKKEFPQEIRKEKLKKLSS